MNFVEWKATDLQDRDTFYIKQISETEWHGFQLPDEKIRDFFDIKLCSVNDKEKIPKSPSVMTVEEMKKREWCIISDPKVNSWWSYCNLI